MKCFWGILSLYHRQQRDHTKVSGRTQTGDVAVRGWHLNPKATGANWDVSITRTLVREPRAGLVNRFQISLPPAVQAGFVSSCSRGSV